VAGRQSRHHDQDRKQDAPGPEPFLVADRVSGRRSWPRSPRVPVSARAHREYYVPHGRPLLAPGAEVEQEHARRRDTRVVEPADARATLSARTRMVGLRTET